MPEMKLTIYADPENFILGVRAAKTLLDSDQGYKICEFENGVTFYTYRTKKDNVVACKLEYKVMMTLEQARSIVLGLGNVQGYLTRQEEKIITEAKRVVHEDAMAVMGALIDDQDPEC